MIESAAVTNLGTIEATSGVLTVAGGSLINDGNLIANGGTLAIDTSVTGNGSETISGSNSVLDLQVASAQNVTFASGAHGILQLDDAPNYTGTIAGLMTGDAIDLTKFQFSGNPAITGISGTGAVGTTTAITIQDGTQTAVLHFVNQTQNNFANAATSFQLKDDGSHGTLLTLHQ